jgi:hypothetical protein
MLLVGWRTKLAVAVSYVHQTSLWWRNPTVLNAGDSVLILLLFWSLFLPLGARASLDARRRGQPLEATHVASVGSAGLLIQLASVYFFSALHKSIGLGWWEGTAVYYAVSHETMSRPFGLWLRQFRPAVAGLTWATLLWEFVGPPLLLSPWWTARLRLAVIGGFAALQLGIGMSMQLWLFPWIMTTALLPFVPAVVWDALDRLRGKPAAETPFVVWAGEDGSPGRRRLVAALAALALAYILMSNVERQIEWQTPRALSRVGRWFGLNQGWYMYAIARPYVVNLAVVGVLRVDGSRLALDDPEAGPHWQELAPLRDIYRGKLFLERLAYLSQESERAGFGDWVCRRWNGTASPSQQIASVELSAVRRSIEPDGSPSHRERELIWTQPCP